MCIPTRAQLLGIIGLLTGLTGCLSLLFEDNVADGDLKRERTSPYEMLCWERDTVPPAIAVLAAAHQSIMILGCEAGREERADSVTDV